jgi:methyl-accepting chemotaxis protein WspA
MTIFLAQVGSFYELYKAGELSEKEAKDAAYKLARNTRYFNNDYFFIYTDKLKALLYAVAGSLRTKPRDSAQDPNR